MGKKLSVEEICAAIVRLDKTESQELLEKLARSDKLASIIVHASPRWSEFFRMAKELAPMSMKLDKERRARYESLLAEFNRRTGGPAAKRAMAQRRVALIKEYLGAGKAAGENWSSAKILKTLRQDAPELAQIGEDRLKNILSEIRTGKHNTSRNAIRGK
jgi:hypothetical protein